MLGYGKYESEVLDMNIEVYGKPNCNQCLKIKKELGHEHPREDK